MTVEGPRLLQWALVLGGPDAGRELDWNAARSWRPADGEVWVHMDRRAPEVQEWLRAEADLDEATCQALLAEETRPRSVVHGEGLLLILRGVNLNPGAEPDDMISLRIWADPGRLISLRQRPFRTTFDVADEVRGGEGPGSVGSLLARLAVGLTERTEPVLDNLDELADALEEGVGTRDPKLVRGELAELRRQVIALRRYLGPQRSVLSALVGGGVTWLEPAQRQQLREAADRTTRQVEDLDALRERAGVIHDELANHVAEQLNARMYLLALVSLIFLPLSLLTGLLGINVGGIPGAQLEGAFVVVCVILAGVGVGIAAALRWMRWL